MSNNLTKIDPYHDEAEWMRLPIEERLRMRVGGPGRADVRGCIAGDLLTAAHEIQRLTKREQELTAQLLETGGELGKVREHNRSLRETLRRYEVEPD